MAKTKTRTKKLSRPETGGLPGLRASVRVGHRVATNVLKTPFFNPLRKTATLPA